MPEITSIDELTGTPHASVFEPGEPRVVRLQLEADERVPEHSHPEAVVVLYVVDGRLEVSLDDETHEVRTGDVVRFDGTREVSPRAAEPSTALVVLSPRPGESA